MSEWEEAETSYGGAFGNGTHYEFTPTEDPRILAVIERDEDAQISQLYDGDAINPIIYVEHRHGLDFRWVAGYDGGEAALMQRAYQEWGWDSTARRWLWIFHGIAAENASGGYDRDGNWIVATSRAYREHVGIPTEPGSYAKALEDVEPIRKDLSDALDGYVYGVGWALNERRLADDGEPIDLHDGEWTIEIECWGFVGEDYARMTAEGFDYGRPDLPTLNRWLKFKLWLGDKLIDWGSRSNVLGRWGKTILKGLTA